MLNSDSKALHLTLVCIFPAQGWLHPIITTHSRTSQKDEAAVRQACAICHTHAPAGTTALPLRRGSHPAACRRVCGSGQRCQGRPLSRSLRQRQCQTACPAVPRSRPSALGRQERASAGTHGRCMHHSALNCYSCASGRRQTEYQAPSRMTVLLSACDARALIVMQRHEEKAGGAIKEVDAALQCTAAHDLQGVCGLQRSNMM